MFQIWCVEDDIAVRNIEMYTLNSIGFVTEGFADSDELFNALESGKRPDLILLDIMLPGADGIQILKRLKNTYSTENIPVIMATAKGMEFDKVQGLDLGADDYLVKPFSMMEMLSRVKAVLRRCSSNKSHQEILAAGQIRMNIKERTVTIQNNQRVSLTFKEFELLKLFLSYPDIVFTREQLLSDIWGCVTETRTVDMHVKTLRQKLGESGALIETVRSVGYKLVPEAGL